ncbi:MAG: glycosyltransferase family 2 protein [Candidatus Shapirobacteria bacterium]|nr:glycosyltransferase family 2 protein [Candidatus Shapirobacteria bacterium]
MVNISVIIPNFNGVKFLPDFFESLALAIKNCPHSRFEIILVDNRSTDNSLEILNAYFPKNKIILNPQNYGFARAVNQGIKAAKYDFVCILNNDLKLNSNWFTLIISNIKPNIACYCGTVMNSSGTLIESQGISFNINGSCIQNNHNQIYLPHLSLHPVWGSSAAAVIYQKSIIQKIGLFDESFFLYIEDVDLAFRLNKKNFLTQCVPQALVYHIGGATSNKLGYLRQYYTFRNWFLLITKNYSTKQLIFNFPQILLERLKNLSYLLKSLIKW